MAFSDYEISSESGHPVALYLFQYGNTYWRYTSNEEELTVGLDENGDPAVWQPLTIADGGVKQGGSDQNDLQLTLQTSTPVAALFRDRKPSGKVWLTIRRYHLGDPDSETPLLWLGTVVNVIRTDEATDQMNGRSIAGTYDRNGLRLSWGRMCPHILYGVGCYVAKEDHAYPREIATLTGNTFTCTVHEDPEEGSFAGGFMEWERADGAIDRLMIEAQSGNDFRVMGATSGLEVGTAVTLYPGCAHNTAACKLFDNLPNYGGFPHMPGKSPFDGSPVF